MVDDIAKIAGSILGAGTYEIGNALFRDLRAFINSSGSENCKITIELESHQERAALVECLRRSAPPIGEYGRLSSAQAGNYGGTWQGIAYEFTVRNHLKGSDNG